MTPDIKQRIEQIKKGKIPNGYKSTKLGIVPEDWEVVQLKDKFNRLSRKNTEGNTNVLTISAQYGLINQEEFFKKEIASDDKSNYYLLRSGEFAYNKSYSSGYPFGAIKRLSLYDKGVVSPLYICFSANADNPCPKFYEQYFEAGRMNHEIQAFAQEGARNHGLLNISVTDFFNSIILVPPVEEQQRIASILSTQDKVIECYEKKIEQLTQMKKFYLQNMFPKRGETVPIIRLRGFTKSWEQRKLSRLIIEYKDTVVSDSLLPILTSSKTEGVIFQEEHFGRKQNHDINGYHILPRNYCTYRNRSDGVDFTFNINNCCDKGIISKFYPVFYGNGSDIFFISLVLNHNEEVLREIAYTCTGTDQKVLSFIDLKKMWLRVPTFEEQTRIAKLFKVFDNLIANHQRKLEEEKKKKKALQQLLLTGIVRV